MDEAERARRSADAMWANDAAAKWFGMSLDEVGPGRAVLSLTVAQQHCNGHGTLHGGVIFALADTAFAFACNSGNAATVAQHATISFIAPGRVGDLLTAEAREVSLRGRSGLYDVTVTGPGGARVAEFRGMSRTIGGHLFEEGGA